MKDGKGTETSGKEQAEEIDLLRKRVAELETLERERKQVQSLIAIGQIVSRTKSLDELLSGTLAKLSEFMGTPVGLLYLLDLKEKALLLKVYRGISGTLAQAVATIKLEMDEYQRLLKWGPPYTSFFEVFVELNLHTVMDGIRKEGGVSFTAVPFSGKEMLYGITLVGHRVKHQFSPGDVELLSVVCNYMAVGAENSMLVEELKTGSITDRVTRLHNRNYFQKRLLEETSRSARYRQEFCLIMFNIDQFEAYCNRVGLAGGNSILEMVGKSVRDCIRDVDIGCRFDVGKFAVILPYTGVEGATIVAERLRTTIETVLKLKSISTHAQLTISLGVACFPLDELSAEGLIHRADAARAVAKRRGSNQVCVASDMPDLSPSEKRGIANLVKDIESLGSNIVHSIAAAVDARDSADSIHSQNVAKNAVAIGGILGLSDRKLRQLRVAALLHDIGKIGIPDNILNSPDPLTEEEKQVLRKHLELGANMVSQVPELAGSAPAIRHYHERFDGTGYPQGLKGDRIPLEARIIAVADAYTNLTVATAIRRALTPQEALRELLQLVNTEFDPDVVNALGKVIEPG
jgi:diguanylate cyclase (GGDEF)-like protein